MLKQSLTGLELSYKRPKALYLPAETEFLTLSGLFFNRA